ncbi:MAG: hypothetical protein LBU14_04720 [Candidatus Peribacteria bacterium]|nr:hypothetical protein [Candidatus Peribacteria bacterium]
MTLGNSLRRILLSSIP